MMKLTGAMFRAGVPMLAGTDTGNAYVFPGFSLHEELALMVQAGATPLQALRSATRNPAKFMHSTDRYGAIAAGKVADLVLLEADPLADIHNTSKISAVFLAGKSFDRPALDQLLNQAKAAATAHQ
jgi:imidazolonepropionase-like amidohydrolase